MYKLLVLDLDGTLVNSRKEITPITRRALLKAQQSGVHLVLASGRPVDSISPLAELLQLEQYGGFVISYNGARIINWSTGEVLHKDVLPPEVLPALYEYSHISRLPILVYQDGCVLTEERDNSYVDMVSFTNKMPVRKAESFLNEVRHPLHKCLMVGDPIDLHQWEMKMVTELGDRMNIYRSSPFILELVPLGVDKAKAISILTQYLGISNKEVIAVGDGYNDRSMIEYAGLGVAMKNAVSEVKEIADFITELSNDRDGLVEVIEKFIL